MNQVELAEIRARLQATSDQPFTAERTPTRGVWMLVAGGEWKPFTGSEGDVEFLINAKRDVERLLREAARLQPKQGQQYEPKPPVSQRETKRVLAKK